MPAKFGVRLAGHLLIGCLLSLAAPSRALADPPGLRWVDNYEQGLVEATRQARPVFVYFDAAWCSWCQQYKQGTLLDPGVRELLGRHYVTVLVDFDARPDLAQRYRVRGLPYTLILSARGEWLNGFVGILTAADMRDLLTEHARAANRATPQPQDDSEAVRVRSLDQSGYDEFRRAYLQHIERLYDKQTGTLLGRFETGATLKRPSPLTWLYLQERGLWPERTARAARVERARLHDPVDGGFFNFLDPSQPGGEYLESSKLLESNAWLTLWQASLGKSDRAARHAADSGLRYMQQVLWDVERGGFWQAQKADNNYYRQTPAQRRTLTAPPLDRIKRADSNAQAVLALLRSGVVRREPAAAALAERTFNALLDTLIHDRRLYHAWRDGKLLTPDQPLDLFWLLAAATELERQQPNPSRRARLSALVVQAHNWIRKEQQEPTSALSPELAGLVAWVSGQPPFGTSLPNAARDWALQQLRIETATPPDDLIFGLWAWEAKLAMDERASHSSMRNFPARSTSE